MKDGKRVLAAFLLLGSTALFAAPQPAKEPVEVKAPQEIKLVGPIQDIRLGVSPELTVSSVTVKLTKSTSIYSGLLRLADLALALPDHAIRMFLVAPDEREKEVLAQLKRPSVLAANAGAVPGSRPPST